VRRLVALLAALALLAAAVTVALATTGRSGAAFTYSSESTVEASVDRIGNWLHLYSQSTDPLGETGYATQVANPSPAATGEDEGIAVLFVIPSSGIRDHNRVLKVRTPAVFPDVSPDPAVTAVNVSVAVTEDPATDRQPIERYGLDVWGAAPTYTHTINGWAAGVQRQLNLRTKFPGNSIPPGTYEVGVVLTLRYTGLTTAFYQYTIPVTIRYQ
jgi:hypothetical protein